MLNRRRHYRPDPRWIVSARHASHRRRWHQDRPPRRLHPIVIAHQYRRRNPGASL